MSGSNKAYSRNIVCKCCLYIVLLDNYL